MVPFGEWMEDESKMYLTRRLWEEKFHGFEKPIFSRIIFSLIKMQQNARNFIFTFEQK